VLTEPIDLGDAVESGAPVAVEATGELTIHGVTTTVTLPLDAQLVDGTIVVTCSLDIALSTYGVEAPTAPIVVSVSDEATIELRGVQESDADGKVTFISILPACYSGRWPHIHFEVYASVDEATGGGEPIATSQLAFPADVCDVAYATEGYEQSVRNLGQLSLASDNVFGDDQAAQQLATVTGDVSEGYLATLAVAV
jgi:hypothetical protein